MCGITGILYSVVKKDLEQAVRNMTETIHHRGPDDVGVWVDYSVGVALGHRRLSILDLSPTGHQPMESPDGRYVLIFNGEIYNHKDLRNQLEEESWQLAVERKQQDCNSIQWRGHSDTETLLSCFEAWGIKETLNRAVGMFALALWDNEERKLYLARDRMGEKPLYYGWVNGALVFGSELKALKAYPGFSNAISRDALALYLQYNYVPAPHSIYENIYKLEPGCYLSLTADAVSIPLITAPEVGVEYQGLSLHRWWSLADKIQNQSGDLIHNEKDALDGLDSRLRESIRLQSIADVPLGAFLSGGIDSSAIVALMQSEAISPVKTFTIGFSESKHNEAAYAKEVARHLGTEHTELYLSSNDALDVIPKLPQLYDEPFADSSQIPTFLVSQMAKQHVTVALSGDGGDELFGGYNRYFWGRKIWNKLSWMPWGLRRLLGTFIHSQPVERWDALSNYACKLFGNSGVNQLGDKAHKLGARLGTVRSMDDLYLSLVTQWASPQPVLNYKGSAKTILDCREAWPNITSDEERMMYLDSMSYLPDDILCKVDRAAMGVSLETRVPFLDHRVVEYAWQLPLSMKIKDGQGKWLLRQLLYKHVPKELIERPKQGFAIPLAEWLRGPLRDWAEELLDEHRLKQEGYFDHELIRHKWREHLSGEGNWQCHLWSVLMFQAWLEVQS